MTVIRFDGVDDRVIFPIGVFNGMAGGPITFGWLFRTDNIAVTRTGLEIGITAGGRIGLGISSGDLIRFFNGSSTRDGPARPVGWFLCVTTKATGTVVPRYHIYDFTAGTWEHGAQGAATANQTLGNGEVRFGESLVAAQDFTGDIGLGFLANVALSDAEVEAMVTNRKTSDIWTAIGGATVFDLYELISASAITSLGGSVETSRTGTTTTAESIPGGWTFDGVGGGVTTQISLAATMVLTPTLMSVKNAPRTLAVTMLNTVAFLKSVSRALAVTTPFSAAHVRKMLRPLDSTVTNTMVMQATKVKLQPLDAAMTLTPTLQNTKITPISVPANVVLAPALSDVATHLLVLAVTAPITGEIRRQLFKRLDASLTLATQITQAKKVILLLENTTTFTSSLAILKTQGRSMNVVVTLTPTMQKKISRTLDLTMATTSQLVKVKFAPRTLATTVAFTAAISLAKLRLRLLEATVTLAGAMTLVRTRLRALDATVTFSPALAKVITRRFDAQASLNPQMVKAKTNFIQFNAPMPFVATLEAVFKEPMTFITLNAVMPVALFIDIRRVRFVEFLRVGYGRAILLATRYGIPLLSIGRGKPTIRKARH